MIIVTYVISRIGTADRAVANIKKVAAIIIYDSRVALSAYL